MQELITFLSQHWQLSVAAAIVMVFLVVIEVWRAQRKSFSLTPAQVTQKINHDNAIVIDIRPLEVYRKGHIINAQSIAFQDLQRNPKKIERYKNRPIVIVCNTGLESQKTAIFLTQQGYQAYALAGGIRSWNDAQMPLIKE